MASGTLLLHTKINRPNNSLAASMFQVASIISSVALPLKISPPLFLTTIYFKEKILNEHVGCKPEVKIIPLILRL